MVAGVPGGPVRVAAPDVVNGCCPYRVPMQGCRRDASAVRSQPPSPVAAMARPAPGWPRRRRTGRKPSVRSAEPPLHGARGGAARSCEGPASEHVARHRASSENRRRHRLHRRTAGIPRRPRWPGRGREREMTERALRAGPRGGEPSGNPRSAAGAGLQRSRERRGAGANGVPGRGGPDARPPFHHRCGKALAISHRGGL